MLKQHIFNNQGCQIKGTNLGIYAGYATLAVIELGDTKKVLALRRKIEMAIIKSMQELGVRKKVHCSNDENDDGSNQGTVPRDEKIRGYGA